MTSAEEHTRSLRFPTTHPPQLEVSVTAGMIRVQLAAASTPESDEDELRVQLLPGEQTFGHGGSNLLGWLGSQLADADGPDVTARAVAQTQVEFSGQRLLVRTPETFPLRVAPVSVLIHAPARSRCLLRSATAGIRVSGESADPEIRSGSGSVEVQRVSGTGSVRTVSGHVDLGTTHGHQQVRSGSGQIRVLQATGGSVALTSGSGSLSCGIAHGVAAWLDLQTHSGRLGCTLPGIAEPSADQGPAGDARVAVRGRTGTGDITVSGAGGAGPVSPESG